MSKVKGLVLRPETGDGASGGLLKADSEVLTGDRRLETGDRKSRM